MADLMMLSLRFPLRRLRHAVLLFLALIAALTLMLAPAATPAQARSARIEALVQSMPLERKAAQLFIGVLYGPTLNAPGRDFLREWQPGGVALFGHNAGTPEATTRLINDWQQTIVDAGGLPMFVATDQEGGRIARLKEGFTTWPVPMLLTASGNVDLAYRVGLAMANELSAVGVNMNLAPVADLYTNLANPVIGRRSFGSDPERTGQVLAALIRGMQAGGVLATAKHFPGHGDTDVDSHVQLPVVSYPREDLERVEFAPFRWTIAAGVESMMMGHLWFPALDPGEPLPTSLSYNAVTGLLRGDMAFNGLVMTDAIEMDAIDTVYSYGEASVRAIEAGVDLIAFGANLGPDAQGRAIQAVIDAVRSGRLPESRIDESLRRVLDAKDRYGLLDWQPLDPDSARARIRTAEHNQLVEELFRAGVTVAYDQGDLVPVQAHQRVAMVYPGTRPAIKSSCEAYHDNRLIDWVSITEEPGPGEIQSALAAARGADITVVFTQNATYSAGQQALVNALPQGQTVAVALFSPYDWQFFPDVAAYLTTYSPLDPGIPAVCALLFGNIATEASLPVALDGAREFVGAGATNGGVRIALAPTLSTSPTPFPTETATITPTPQPTATATPTREPIESGRRDPVAPPGAGQSVGGAATAIPLPSLEPSPTPTTAPTVVAMAPPDTAQAVPAVPAVVLPPVTPEATGIALMALGSVLVAAAIYGGLLTMGVAASRRYRGGFVVDRCPVCGQPALNVRQQSRHWLGIPRPRFAVTCDACHSVLREAGRGLWRYRINKAANPHLHQRFDSKVIDEKTLKLLARERWK